MTGTRKQRQANRAPNRALIALRVNRGLGRADLERLTGVSRESIRIAERGFVPGPRIQFALAAYFECEPLDIWPIEQQRAVAA